MALDKQKILHELESVVNQLQSANCGCLGNVFNQHVPNSHQQMKGYVTPQNCGHNYHDSTCGHIPGERFIQGSCGEPCSNVQPQGNCTHHQHPTNSGITTRSHFDPAIVQPIVNEVYEELKTMTPENTIVNSPIANHMGLPIAQDSHNIPHKYNTINMPDMQKAMENAKAMQAIGNQFMHAVNMTQNPANNEYAQPNSPKLAPPAMHSNVMQCQNCKLDAAVPNNNVIQANAHPILQHQSSYGQHAQGMAKFQELFPGVMGNGDLGFDPMEVAIKMNPNNQQNAQMPAQNALNNRNKITNACHRQSASELLQNPAARNINMPLTNTSIPSMGTMIADTAKGAQSQSNNGLCPNEQQVYQISPRRIPQEKVAVDANQMHRAFQPTTEHLMNEVLSGSQVAPKPGICDHMPSPVTQVPQVQPQGKMIEYNTLGQPVEILPAELYHKPEDTSPQTLSPQPNTPNNFASSCMKGSMNKDHVMVNQIASNKTPCLMANPMSYGTHSDGQLNVNFNQKNTNSFIERTVGDTVINNKSPRQQAPGDRPLDAQPDVCTPEKLSPNSARKHRNGLQDIVFTSYPKSTKWSFHGNARKTSAQRPT